MEQSTRRTVGFWLLALTAMSFFAASAAPSPLYLVYAARWHFSATVLTLIFAVYVLALLVALLTVGGLSDFVGRRPVVAAALVAEALSMLLFIGANGTASLFLARAVQGFATGAAAGALSAGLADLSPRPTLASAINTAAPSLGLAVGALLSGALVEYGPAPRTLVYVVLVAVFVAVLAALPLLPESVQRRPGAAHSLLPRMAVPVAARSAFSTAVPVLVATWAVGGLMLSLGPSIAAEVFGVHNYLVEGLVVTAVAGVGSVSAVAARNRRAGETMVRASVVLAVGAALVVVSLAARSTVLFYAALVVSGVGFGASFVAALGSIAPHATADQRAELFAAIFVVSYGAFGGSAVIAGLVVPSYGLRPTSTVYGIVVIVLSLLAAFAELRRARAEP
jgi:MFS family permease